MQHAFRPEPPVERQRPAESTSDSDSIVDSYWSPARTSDTDTVLVSSRLADIAVDRLTHAWRHDLLRTLDHELRTPLATARVSLEVLNDPSLEPHERGRLVAQLERSVHWATSILDNFALTSLKHRDAISRSFQQTSVRDFISAAVKLTSPMLRARRQRVRLTCIDPPPLVEGHPVWLRQVMVNLLVNASRYSRCHDEIELRVENSDSVCVSVTDHGAGVPFDEQADLFERDVRGRRAHETDSDGRGLGLFIARTIVEVHGGAVGLFSSPGEGTTVWFTLPSTTHCSAMIGESLGQEGCVEDTCG